MEQLEMMLKGAVASGKDVQAFWVEGRLTKIKYANPIRGRRTWKVMEFVGSVVDGKLNITEESDNSDL
jgi:hypothetical protein